MMLTAAAELARCAITYKGILLFQKTDRRFYIIAFVIWLFSS